MKKIETIETEINKRTYYYIPKNKVNAACNKIKAGDVILITTKLIELAPDVISEIKLKQQKPLLVEIPDRHGNSKIGETIDRYVSEAIGVKL